MKMPDSQVVGRVLRAYRLERGLSQEVLSGLAGLDRTHYSKLERGLRSPNLETLFRLAQALDVAPHVLVRAIEEACRE